MADGIAEMKAKREAARAAREAARTARTPPAPHHPREQVAGETASDSASGEAGVSASENAGESAGRIDGGNAGAPGPVPERVNAGRKVGGKTGAKARKGGGPPRRRGRPRGPERVTLSVRILSDLDARLTAECDASETGPQEVVEAALAAWLARQERRRAE